MKFSKSLVQITFAIVCVSWLVNLAVSSPQYQSDSQKLEDLEQNSKLFEKRAPGWGKRAPGWGKRSDDSLASIEQESSFKKAMTSIKTLQSIKADYQLKIYELDNLIESIKHNLSNE